MSIIKYLKFCEERNLSKESIQQYKCVLNKVLKVEKNSFEKVLKIITNNKNSASYQKLLKIVYYNYLTFFNLNEEAKLLKLIKIKHQDLVYRAVIEKNELYSKTEVLPEEKGKKIEIYKKLLKFMFETGVRVGELKTLTFENSKLYVIGKGNKKRQIFYKADTFYFLFDKLNIIKKVTKTTIGLWVKKILGNEYSSHSLRRSFATYLLNNNADPKMVMQLMGHSDINTTFKYLHNTEEQNKQIYNKFFN